MHKAKAGQKVGVTIFGALLLGFWAMSPAVHITQAYADTGGSLTVTVVHPDGFLADPEDFTVDPYSQAAAGFFSLYASDNSLLGEYPTCNYSADSCEISNITAGRYSVVISLARYMQEYSAYQGTVDQLSNEYLEEFSVTEGAKKEVTIVVDYGYIETTIVDGNGASLDPEDFASLYISEGGYYSIYNDEGEPVLDAVACNTSGADSCRLALGSGIYEARVVAVDNNLRVYKLPFEVVDKSSQQLTIAFAPAGSTTGGSTGTGQGGSGSSSGSTGSSGSNNANSGTTSGSSTSQPSELVLPEDMSISFVINSQFIDHDGAYHLVGEVQNNATFPVGDVSIWGSFYDFPSNDVVTVRRGDTFLDALGPKEKSPFEIIIKDPSIAKKVENYTVTATAFPVPSSSLKPSFLGVNITSHSAGDRAGTYHVFGKIVNYGAGNANFIKILVLFYDAQGNVIHTASRYTNSHVESGAGVGNFKLTTNPSNASNIASVSALVQSQEYSMVEGGFLESPIEFDLDSSTYDSGMPIRINGTVGTVRETQFFIIETIWPNGFNHDRDLVRITPGDGKFEKTIFFYSSDEFIDKKFTVRVLFDGNFSEAQFTFMRQ